MRETQFAGLSTAGRAWLEHNCRTFFKKVTTDEFDGEDRLIAINTEIITPLVQEDTGKIVTGMFGEEVWYLQRYWTKDERPVVEYVQAEPWSSGPVIFLALKYEITGDSVEESLWPEEEIENC